MSWRSNPQLVPAYFVQYIPLALMLLNFVSMVNINPLHSPKNHLWTSAALNKILNATDERYIVRKTQANPRLSVPKLITEIHNNRGKTCCVDLFSGSAGSWFSWPRKCQLSELKEKSRLQFAKEHFYKGPDFWNSDESKFNMFWSDYFFIFSPCKRCHTFPTFLKFHHAKIYESTTSRNC